MKTFDHAGRAANCKCHTLHGPRCPDCRHVLTEIPEDMRKQKELSRDHEEIVCAVCYKRIKSQKSIEEEKQIKLTVQDVKQHTSSKF